jgi:prepilin-type N-terminal cleavage/methylation domain-containing protein
MSNAGTARQSGFTLIELSIVLAIVAVITGLALFTFTGAKVDLQRQGIAREFKVYLERARFDSVKRRAALEADQARIVLNGPSSFTARIDFDGDGSLGTNDSRLVDFRQRSGTQIVVSNEGLAYPVTIRFDQRGQVRVTDNLGFAVNPVAFTICSSTNCSTTSPDRTLITVSPSGTVAVFRNAQAPPPAPTPIISNVTPTLNCYVLITNANTTCSL